MKKILAFVLTLVMAASLLVGCGETETKATEAQSGSEVQTTAEEKTESSVVTAKVIDIALNEEVYAYGVDKDQPELLEKVNELIKQYLADGTFDEINNHYFGDGTPVGVTSNAYDDSKDQFVVATNANFEPFEYMDGDKFYGVDMEIAAKLAEALGQELVIIDMDFDAVCLSVGEHKCDIAMAGLTVKPEREEFVTFSETYYNANQVLVTLSNDTKFADCKTKEDIEAVFKTLDEKTIVSYQIGTTGDFYVNGDEDWGFTKLPVTATGYKTGALAIQNMLNGTVNYVIIDAAPAKCITEKLNDLLQ